MPKHKTRAEIRESNKRFAELDKVRSKEVLKKKAFSQKQSLCSKYKNNLKRKATPSELVLLDLFKKAKIRAMFQKGFIADAFYIVDFYIPKWRLCVEVDGGYHFTPEQIEKDKCRDFYLTNKRKLNVLRLTNEEVMTLSVGALLTLLSSKGYQ